MTPPDPRPAPPHILTLAQTLAGGGVERAMLRLAGGWIDRGAGVTLVLGDRAGPLAAELPAGITIASLGDARYRALLRLDPVVAATRPDIVFCPGNHYTAAAAALRLRMGSACPPIVGKLSNALVRADQPAPVAWGYRRWLRLHPRFLDRLVAMTPGMATEAHRAMAMPVDRIAVIPNPPAPPPARLDPALLPPGRFVLGVGRLAPQKRWDRLIAAFAAIGDPSLTLAIAGDGALRGDLERQAAALGVVDRVRLVGHVPEPGAWMQAASLVALTSDYEGAPGVLREAIALGTPVVATDASVAVREIVADDARGSVVPPGDHAALVAAIRDRLARSRPTPPDDDGGDPVGAYLSLFAEVIARRA